MGAIDKCWLWRRGKNSGGYGSVNHDGTTHPASRVAYIIAFGKIPDGLLVRHKCDVRDCCNPFHLELGTHQDNVNDRVARGRGGWVRSEDSPHAKLTREAVAYIRANPDKLLQRELAAKFGVTQGLVSKVKLGRTWREE